MPPHRFFPPQKNQLGHYPNLCGNASGSGPVIAVVDGINSAHRFLAGLLFDIPQSRDHEPGRSHDHENTVEGRWIHPQIGEDSDSGKFPNRAIWPMSVLAKASLLNVGAVPQSRPARSARRMPVPR
jgi:hypothetical protein